MKRASLLAAALFFAVLCPAQQPDVRVRLLTLYSLPQITVVPGKDTSLAWGGRPRPLRSPTLLRAVANRVMGGGSSGPLVLINGDFQIAGTARTLAVHVPVEVSARGGRLQIIARYPVEEYVAAVLQGETAGDMPPAALKALAVAIRSYATRFRERHGSEGFDFCDTTHCQYLRPEVTPAVRAAVAQTFGELLWDRGVPLAAYYHKDCGGRTEAAAAVWPDQRSPLLSSRPDPYCIRTTNPWRADIPRTDITRALEAANLTVPRGWNRIAISERTPSGRARTLRFGLGAAPQGTPVSASSFRFALGRSLGWNTLKSDWYDVANLGDRFVFTGRGVGHGVGLCQTGAAEMARQGKNYRDILAFYYASAPIGRSAQGIPWQTASGEAFDVLVVNAADLAPVRAAAARALASATEISGLTLRLHPVIEVYPTVPMFRDATGEPGWVAATTRGNHIRLEPPAVLAGRLEAVLRHEFLHLLVESNAQANTPLWFREGMVVYLTGGSPGQARGRLSPEQIDETIRARRSQVEMENAYAAAAALVADLDQRWCRAEGAPHLPASGKCGSPWLRWLRDGLPDGIVAPRGARSHEVP